MSNRSGDQLVLGIDGGNSKTDLALADGHGLLLGAIRGETVSHQAIGLDAGMARLAELASRLGHQVGRVAPADIVVATLAGADYPEDVRMLKRAISRLGLGRDVVVLNDTYGALRAGTSAGWGIALVCGQGVNAAATAPDGRRARFSGVGDISGDWGGGGGIGMAALQAAVRGRDGRGPGTSLERAVPAFFGVRTPDALTRALYFERIPLARVSSLAPIVFAEAAAGDSVARGIIDRLADELAGMATALIRRLHMTRLDIEVVLAGGVFRTRHADFYARLESGIRGAAPHARMVRLDAPPVAGALILGIEAIARQSGSKPPGSAARARLKHALKAWDASLGTG